LFSSKGFLNASLIIGRDTISIDLLLRTWHCLAPVMFLDSRLATTSERDRAWAGFSSLVIETRWVFLATAVPFHTARHGNRVFSRGPFGPPISRPRKVRNILGKRPHLENPKALPKARRPTSQRIQALFQQLVRLFLGGRQTKLRCRPKSPGQTAETSTASCLILAARSIESQPRHLRFVSLARFSSSFTFGRREEM